MKMRPEQKKVAEYDGGYLAVPAVPGAGKTTCLAYLAAKLLAGDPKNKILIVTVMNSAVSNFKRRISYFLAEQGLPPRGYQVKTLHSLAALILKEKPEYLMINEAFEILDEQQQSKMLSSMVERWLSNNHHRWTSFLDDKNSSSFFKQNAEPHWRKRLVDLIPDIIKLVKLRGLTTDETGSVRDKLKEGPDCFLRWAFEVMEDYDYRKRREGTVDFDDLTNFAYHLLRNDEGVRKRLQERWTYVFEDESQDSNPLQEKILGLLCAGRGNFVRVGDTNQGIMRFSGTDPELFRRFCREHPAQSICVASRSTREIMDFANHFVDWVRNFYIYEPCRDAFEDRKIVGVDSSDPTPNPVVEDYGIRTFFCDRDGDQEDLMAAETVIEYARNNRDQTIAILARSNRSLKNIAERLRREKEINFDFVGGNPDSLEDFRRVAYIWTVLRFLAEPFNRDYLSMTLLGLVPGVEEGAENRIRGLIEGSNPEDLLYSVGGEPDWLSFSEYVPANTLPRLQDAFQLIRRWLEMSYLRSDELVLQIAFDLGLEGNERDLANNLCTQVNKLIRQHPEYGLFEVVGEMEPIIKPNLRYMAVVLQGSKGYEPRRWVISLSTQHKAKGLEWDAVYIVGLAADQFFENVGRKNRSEVWCLAERYKNPLAMAHAQLMFLSGEKCPGNVRQWANINQISEDLRLLYVSFTRARRYLWISSHKYDPWKKVLPTSKIFEEIQRYIKEKRNA